MMVFTKEKRIFRHSTCYNARHFVKEFYCRQQYGLSPNQLLQAQSIIDLCIIGLIIYISETIR